MQGMDPRISRALARMEYHLAVPQTIAGLAADLNLSASYFSQLFHREVGTPPARYLHALRLVRAQVLLERGFLTVTEVMGLVGFRDASHFARDFRRAHGVSPDASRHRSLSGDRAAGKALLRGDRRAVVASIAAFANHRLAAPRTAQSPLSAGIHAVH
jgi:transcriptional regulator GlxA family with amidase domain